MSKAAERDAIYNAAARFVEVALVRDDSLFTPGKPVWSRKYLDELQRKFVERPDESSDSFEVKLSRQLSDASDETIQLAAELLYAHFLPAADISGNRKRTNVRTVLSWGSRDVEIPPDLSKALDMGLAATGIAFNTLRPHQLWFLIAFMRAWKELTKKEQEHLQNESWAFKDFLFAIEISSAYAQRDALLHLVHPETFEPIVSRTHKKQIAEKFKERASSGVDDVDRALLEIRTSFEEELGTPFNFYQSGIVEQWRPGSAPEPSEEGVRHAFLIRGRHSVVAWLKDGYCAVGWKELGPLDEPVSREQLYHRLQTVYPDAGPGRLRNQASSLHRYLYQVKRGDLVVTTSGSDVYVGVVTSESTFVDAAEPLDVRRREVEWANPSAPVSKDALSDAAVSKLRALRTLSDITEHLSEFARLAGIHDVLPVSGQEFAEVQMPTVNRELSERLLVPQAWLEEIVSLLTEKRQVVFYGPPGTGKTFLAQALAGHLTADGGTFALVQFHPSYAYEDFFEGFRPRQSEDAAGLTYELVAGPLRRIAEEAGEERNRPYILIIDEINRANLAKVFGELYFLLEYRDHAITLQYSPEDEFILPPNIFFIGTMNTADRSIALVDAAMRRRFYFVPFFPDDEPIRGLLRLWLSERELPTEAADLLEALNGEVDDPDFAIGPSYFMTNRVAESGGLERIWKHAILPLLEEHYFGQGIDVNARFSIDATRRALQGSAAADPADE